MTTVPEGWTRAPLSSVTTGPTKLDPKQTDRTHIKYLDIGSLEGPSGEINIAEEIESARAPSRCRQVLAAGDTVYSTVRPYLRKQALIGAALDGEFASTGFAVLRPVPPLIPEYLYHFTTSDAFQDQVIPLQKGMSYPAVLDRDVRTCRIWYPEPTEQHRIVERLQEHLYRLEIAERNLRASSTKTELLARSWLSNAFASADNFTSIGSVLMSSQAGLSRAADEQFMTQTGFPYLKMNNVTRDGRIDLTDVRYTAASPADRVKYELREDDVVFNCRNSAELVGKSAIISDRESGFLYNNNLLRLRFSPDIDPRFAHTWFLSPQWRAEIAPRISATTSVAAIYQRDLKSCKIPLLSRDAQFRIVQEFTALDEQVAPLVHMATGRTLKIAALRRSVLSAAFSGRLTGQSSDTEILEETAERLDRPVQEMLL